MTKTKTKEVVTDIIKIENEVKPIEEKMHSLKEQAVAMIIVNDEDYGNASIALDIVNSEKKAADKMRKFFVDPLNQQVKSINSLFNPRIDSADEIVKIIKGKMAEYFEKKEAERIKEEKRLQAIRDAANKKREEAGKELIAEPIREVAEPEKTVIAGNSKAQVRKKWTAEVEHIDMLPDEIKKAIMAEAYRKGIVDSVVQKFVDAGAREIAGVKIYEKTIIATGNIRGW